MRTKEGRDYSIIPAWASDRLWLQRAACSPSDAERSRRDEQRDHEGGERLRQMPRD